MNKAKLTNDDAYSELLNELAQLQIQITAAKPTNLKTLLDRQLTIHEAITQFPAPTEADKGKVFDVVEKGYFLNDKVIRFAKVVVAN